MVPLTWWRGSIILSMFVSKKVIPSFRFSNQYEQGTRWETRRTPPQNLWPKPRARLRRGPCVPKNSDVWNYCTWDRDFLATQSVRSSESSWSGFGVWICNGTSKVPKMPAWKTVFNITVLGIFRLEVIPSLSQHKENKTQQTN